MDHPQPPPAGDRLRTIPISGWLLPALFRNIMDLNAPFRRTASHSILLIAPPAGDNITFGQGEAKESFGREEMGAKHALIPKRGDSLVW